MENKEGDRKTWRSISVTALYILIAVTVFVSLVYITNRNRLVSLHEDVLETRSELDEVFNRQTELLHDFIRQTGYFPLNPEEEAEHVQLQTKLSELEETVAENGSISSESAIAAYNDFLQLQDTFFILLHNNYTIPSAGEADASMLTLLRYRNYFDELRVQYNTRVERFNSMRKTFPANLIARYLEIPPKKKLPPYMQL